ncbi:amidohydrolase family protein [Alteraurantiacibacter aestuarii]|uniref:Amidohydrolase family protein n=1 Tax=Alteraurantiacibacter aestuarii TaxID=650004 RepID=A0A844ZML4_9SPHN|nr:amidohydrolase family protein [Alteraurantiacibacter aestuarii]MXO88290.1 amidohydrolase family protein [Alteraurantiacibacter aestuarii]
MTRKLALVSELALALAVLAAPAAAQDFVLIDNIGPDAGSILIEDGTIVFNGPSDGLPPHQTPTTRIDARGLHLLPGLIDMHVHVWSEAGLGAYLAHGVTTVRNLSGMPFHLRMAEAVEAGQLTGPHLFTSGPILNSPGPNAQINHQIVLTREDGREAVRAQAEAGYTRIKTYSNLTADAWHGVLEEAQARGMALTGHTPEGERLEGIPHERPFQIPFADILDAEWETIEHVESIYFHGLSDQWDDQAARALAERIASAGTPVTPTLVAHRNLVNVAVTRGEFAQRPGMEWLNPVTQALQAPVIEFWAGQDPAFESERADHYANFTAMLRDAGVLLVAGSDAGIFTNIPGASLLDELELLVDAGLTPDQAIASATSNAALALGEQGRLGCLDAGCLADVVFYLCDPIADMACLREPAGLIRAGRWYDEAGLAALRAGAADHDVEQVLADLMAGMEAQGTPLDPAVLGM